MVDIASTLYSINNHCPEMFNSTG